MGKKKSSSAIKDNVDKYLQDKFGNVFLSGKDITEKEKQIIPATPALNLSLGGGIPEGSFVIITGAPKYGKTQLALYIAAQAQQEKYGSRKTYFANIEGRIKKRDLEGVKGLELTQDKFEVICSTEEKILYAEDYLEILLAYVSTKTNSIFIVDSISQLCSKSRTEGNVGDRFRDDVPLMLASFTKQVSNILPINNNIVICITHLIANQGMGMSQWSEASGQKVQYQSDVKIKALYIQPHMEGERQIGQIVNWQCVHSAIGPPMGKATSLLRYGYGLDTEYDLVKMAIDIGIIVKKGAWFTLPNDVKCQGIEKACDALRQDIDLYKTIDKQIYELLT